MMVELKYKLGKFMSDVKQLNKKIVVNTLPKGAPAQSYRRQLSSSLASGSQ